MSRAGGAVAQIDRAIHRANELRFEAIRRGDDPELHRQATDELRDAEALALIEHFRNVLRRTTARLVRRLGRKIQMNGEEIPVGAMAIACGHCKSFVLLASPAEARHVLQHDGPEPAVPISRATEAAAFCLMHRTHELVVVERQDGGFVPLEMEAP